MDLKIISAGAGSGKTYRLTQELTELLKTGVRPDGIIATTFTQKAAAELQERVRVKLLEEGFVQEADELSNALIGTVHGLGVKLLRRFSFEAGVSPQVDIIADEDRQQIFNKAVAMVLPAETIDRMERLCDALGLNKRARFDWRQEIRKISDTARANNFDAAVLRNSRDRSFATFEEFLPQPSTRSEKEWREEMQRQLTETIQALQDNADETKKTRSAVGTLRKFLSRLKTGRPLYWHEWAKVAKLGVGAKSREDMAALQEFAGSVESHPRFRRDIQAFIYNLFDLSISAIQEYEQYKRKRGLIDYIDMEALINQLLDRTEVRQVLREEIDLLLVDEFQDTSPIQLSIFWKLSALVPHAIWVGDPKQSIYGFRGADPAIMRALIEQTGGIDPANIQRHSWRSREDIVYAVNALFTRAFRSLPPEQVALQPKRRAQAGADTANKEDEPPGMIGALRHWHFEPEEGGRTNKAWMSQCIAHSLREFLDNEPVVFDKHEETYRKLQAGDVAVLCRTNPECQAMAEALHQAGLTAAISREGLLQTPEVKLILACLKFVLNEHDSLSVAEILRLSGEDKLQGIIESRLRFIRETEGEGSRTGWASDRELIHKLNDLRPRMADLSSSEILDFLLNELHLRHLISAWGQFDQRQDNVDALRHYARRYEEACNRLHSGASLGGFLLWLDELNRAGQDQQGAGAGPHTVNVLTYHRSKGLEWPVVICHNLENRMRDSVYGMELEEEKPGELDLENILGHRWVRYWVNPYQDQEKNMPLYEKISESEAQKKATRKALEEEARLLYVGLTRARDYLIFPSRAGRNNPTRWLNRCWNEGQEDEPTLIPGEAETPWLWNDCYLPIRSRQLNLPVEFEPLPPLEEPTLFFARPAGYDPKTPYRINPDHPPFDDFSPRTSPAVSFHPRWEPPEEVDPYQLAKALKVMLTGDHADYPAETSMTMAKGILQRFELEDIAPEAVCRYVDRLEEQVQKSFSFEQEKRKVALRYFRQDQLFETVVDRLLIGSGEVVLLQHSGFSGSESQLKNQAMKLAPWCYYASEALAAQYPGKRVRTLIHFVLGGCLLEVESQVSGPAV